MMYLDEQLSYERELMDQLIEKEMHAQKRLALRKLSSVVAHFRTKISILAYSLEKGRERDWALHRKRVI